MCRPRILMLAAAALAILVLAVCWRGERPPAPREAAESVTTRHGLEQSRADSASTDSTASSLATPPGRAAVPTVADPRAIVRGRCVDEDGRPIAGAVVSLGGFAANADRMARHRFEEGEVRWAAPGDVVTDADGRFEHRFDPPPPYQFLCEARRDGCMPVRARWSAIARGSVHDLGDLVLARGVTATGIVADAAANPAVGVRVQLLAERDPRALSRANDPAIAPRDDASAITEGRGRFAMATPLPPGRYRVSVHDHLVLEPNGSVDLSHENSELRIVVGPDPDAGVVISGIVVDEAGAPIAAGRVGVADLPLGGTMIRDGGRFTLRRSEWVPTQPVQLACVADGYHEWRSEEAITWGTTDVRIALRAGPPLTVRVRRADDGSPVERFAVTMGPDRKVGRIDPSDFRLRHGDTHAGGELRIAAVTPEKYRLTVVPDESSRLGASGELRIEVLDGVAQTVDVALHAIAERTVVVVTDDGEPVEGARVELLEQRRGHPITPDTVAMDPPGAAFNDPDHVAVLLDDRATGTSGRTTVRATGGRDYALRVTGAGLAPHVEQPFRLDGEGVARVVVSSGATLVGRITPASLVASFRQEAGLPASGPVAGALARSLPNVALRQGQRRYPHPMAGASVLADDGTFEIDAIPPGEWDVVLQHTVAGTTTTAPSIPLAAGVTLGPGERRELSIDLSHQIRRAVELDVRLDGEPCSGSMQLSGEPSQGGHSEHRFFAIGSNGSASLRLPPGAWSPTLQARVDGAEVWFSAPAFDVAPGEGVRSARLEFESGSCEVVVLAPDGAPAGGVELVITDPERRRYLGRGFRTDGAGRVTIRGARGPVAILTERKPLQDERTRRSWMLSTPSDRLARAQVEVGSVHLVPGGGAAAITLRLPSEWNELPE